MDDRPTERRIPIESSSGFRLLVVSGERADTFSLPASGEVEIGRDAACQIRIDDARLSRRHALLVVGPEIVLRDLGSVNGCQVGGRHLAAHESTSVAPGVVITLGGATLVVQRGHASMRLRHVRSHDYFEARVEDECARAESRSSVFAVARLRCVATASTRVEAVLARWLRPMDVVALYAPCEYEVLLLDTAPGAARQLCDAIVNELGDAVSHWALCAFPEDARTPEALARGLAGSARADDGAPTLGLLAPQLELIARGNISVLLLGETGVGKEVAAAAIHKRSRRANEPLVSINCAAFSEALLESELFGYERGAFTGAIKAKAGLIESADGGTLFLDEVGETPPSLQAKLLRVLEQREVLRIGALRPRSIDVRVISATNRDLEAEVTRGAFRRDLYYRLAAETVLIPPLRERRREIAGLAALFIAQSTSARAPRDVPTITAEALDVLESYTWPGNVRELRNVIERAVLVCAGTEIRPEHFPTEKMGRTLPPVTAKVLHSAPAPASPADAHLPLAGGAAGGPLGGDRERIVAALAQCAGNQTQAARMLGMSRSTLVKRLEAFALPRPRRPPV